MIRIHFINVGHGDCIVIEFLDSNRTSVIDINMTESMDDDSFAEVKNEAINLLLPVDKLYYTLAGLTDVELFDKAGYKTELTNPITYITGLNTGSIFRFISTHPHTDHLSGLNELKSKLGVTNFWIIKNSFSPDEKKINEAQKEDWKLYKKYRDTAEHKLDEITVVRPKEGTSNQYWSEDKITILSPNDTLINLAKEKNNPNIMSYVLLIEYGGHKIVLGGDAEEDTWKYIYEKYPDLIKNVTILKASHHGRDSGYYQPAVKHMNPEYTIVSVGKKPETDASNKYKQYSRNVWSTRWKGNIIFELNQDGTGTYEPE
jgi:beta-lactamase superfamily II metal-dependent hydrolase